MTPGVSQPLLEQLRAQLVTYSGSQRSFHDIHSLLTQFPSLKLVAISPNIVITGPLPVQIKSQQYGIPLEVSIGQYYPSQAPLFWVRCTHNMRIDSGGIVGADGYCHIAWSPETTLLQVVIFLQHQFALKSPVYSLERQPMRPPVPAKTQPPQATSKLRPPLPPKTLTAAGAPHPTVMHSATQELPTTPIYTQNIPYDPSQNPAVGPNQYFTAPQQQFPREDRSPALTVPLVQKQLPSYPEHQVVSSLARQESPYQSRVHHPTQKVIDIMSEGAGQDTPVESENHAAIAQVEAALEKVNAELGGVEATRNLAALQHTAQYLDFLEGSVRDESQQLIVSIKSATENSSILKDSTAKVKHLTSQALTDAPPQPLEIVVGEDRQILEAWADDQAISDTITALGRALDAGNVELEAFVKYVRVLARDQFSARVKQLI